MEHRGHRGTGGERRGLSLLADLHVEERGLAPVDGGEAAREGRIEGFGVIDPLAVPAEGLGHLLEPALGPDQARLVLIRLAGLAVGIRSEERR